MKHYSYYIVWSLISTLLIGCGQAVPEPVELAPTAGTITIDGKPEKGVSVIFSPKFSENAPKRAAVGITDENGRYELKYLDTKSGSQDGETGIEPGLYAVTFSWFAAPDGSLVPLGKTPVEVGATQQIPEKYQSSSTTDFEAQIGDAGGIFDFDIVIKGGQETPTPEAGEEPAPETP